MPKKDPAPIGTIETVVIEPKIAGEDVARPVTRFDLEAKAQKHDKKKKGGSVSPVIKQRSEPAVRQADRSYDAPESLSRELSLIKGGMDKAIGRFVSFLKSYNSDFPFDPFQISALFSAFIIFFVKDPVTDETRNLMMKYINVLLEKTGAEAFEKIVVDFGKLLEENRKNASSK